jgi:hypothetical protein
MRLHRSLPRLGSSGESRPRLYELDEPTTFAPTPGQEHNLANDPRSGDYGRNQGPAADLVRDTADAVPTELDQREQGLGL